MTSDLHDGWKGMTRYRTGLSTITFRCPHGCQFVAPRCEATAAKTGQRCRMAAVEGSTVCQFHGGGR